LPGFRILQPSECARVIVRHTVWVLSGLAIHRCAAVYVHVSR
jgi:hypothetical protein